MRECEGVLGRIQSIVSFSTFDGPGPRSVIFLQGCPMGCIFCHNPESWDVDAGEEVETVTLLRRMERFRSFLPNPGLTISGGEPLFQPEFTLELILQAKALGWHVAVDTSGWGPTEPFQKVAEAADLIIFSVKHPWIPEKLAPGAAHQDITTNLKTLVDCKIRFWLRYVLLPGWNDELQSFKALGEIVRDIQSLERLEIIPFNSLAAEKWRKLGKMSPLFSEKNLKVSEEQIKEAERQIAWYRKQNCNEHDVDKDV